MMYNKFFSHIYVENQAFKYDLTKEILGKYAKSEIICVDHYKDVFSRRHQNFGMQKKSPALILAVNNGKSIYKGAQVCQDFGNKNFYYCTNVKNCIYDCEYCYLQGMYTSANIVVYVNIEDNFKQLDELLKTEAVYLCISYDTDLIALESLTGFAKRWCEYAGNHPKLKIELRTKCGSGEFIKNCQKYINDNIIFAWTLSPDYIINRYEHGTAGLCQRVEAANMVIKKGGRIHLCFDPMIYCEEYTKIYGEMFDYVFKNIELKGVEGVSAGTFRISKSYLKNMRRQRQSEITCYPYICHNGVYEYDRKINGMMLDFAKSVISKYVSDDIIYQISDAETEV